MTIQSWKHVLRWLVFLPAATVAAVLAQWAARTIHDIAASIGGPDPGVDLFWVKLGEAVISSAIMGAVFVYVGARVAPAYKVHVAYTLTVIAILVSGFLSYPAIAQHNWWALTACISVVGGSIGLLYSVVSGGLNIETHRLT